MRLNTNSGLVFFVMVLGLILISGISFVEAQNICCVTSGGSCVSEGSNGQITGAECDDLSGYIELSSCDELRLPGGVCEAGCCCLQFQQDGTSYDSFPTIRDGCQNAFYFVPGPALPSCDAVCGVNFVKVTGTVVYNDNTPAQQAIVSFTAQGETFTATTNSQGDYEIYLKINNQYSVLVKSAVNVQCTFFSSLSVGTTNLNSINYQLPCPPQGSNPGICYDCFIYEFEFPEQQCGIVTVTDKSAELRNCEPGSQCADPIYQNGQNIFCEFDPGTCNINGIRETGEICDPLATNNPTPPACPDGGIGSAFCSAQCDWSFASCLTCPTNVLNCNVLELCGCEICENAPICEGVNECSNNQKLDLEVRRLTNDWGFLVSWELEQPCTWQDVSHYDISGCMGNDAGTACKGGGSLGGDTNLNIIVQGVPNNVVSFSDTSFSPDFTGYYCYSVTAVMNNFYNPDLEDKISTPELVCKKLVPDACEGLTSTDRVCVDNKVMQCNPNGAPTEVKNCEPGVCIEEVDGTKHNAFCADSNICTFCNGPFGVFGYNNLNIKNTEYYEALKAIYSKNIPDNCKRVVENTGICFSDDYSNVQSAVGQVKACSEITSCYDYRTMQSCESSPCSVPAAQNCEWVPINGDGSDNKELGIGVCRPADITKQDCSKCDEGSILGTCTKSICSIYGSELSNGLSRCYFNEVRNRNIEGDNYITDAGTCINYEKVSCETYDSKEECVGNPPQEFTTNIVYSTFGVKSGTNAVINPSTDLYDKGRCVWNDAKNYCYKDSDNSRNNPDPATDQPSFDCEFSNEAACILDMEAPVTETSLEEGGYYSIAELMMPKFMVTDNAYNLNGITTYFKVHDSEAIPSNTYPNKESITPEDFLGEGAYTIRFFSMDDSKNHEEIKSININVLKPLNFDVDYELSSAYIVGSDTYEVNLTARVVWDRNPSAQEYLKCTSKLIDVHRNGFTFAGLGDGTKLWPATEWEYFNLRDSEYVLNVTCEDNHYQRLTVLKTISVEADSTIIKPHPRGGTYRASEIEFGIETIGQAECRYTINPPTYVPPENPKIAPPGWNTGGNNWVLYEDSDGFNHSSEILFDDTGMKVIFSMCTFDDGSQFFGNFADAIYFAIDELPPTLNYYENGFLYNQSGPLTTKVTLVIDCKDLSVFYGSQDLSFGCSELMLCNYTSLQDPCVPTYAPTRIGTSDQWQHTFFAPPAGSGTLRVNFKVNDTGGNERSTSLALTTLRNLTFQPPTIIICDPETGINCTNQSG